MPKLSQRISNLSESQTIAMARKSRERIAEGHDVISLSIGEPDFNTPDFIKEAGKRAIDENYSHYTPVPGLPELRKAICNKFKRDNNLEYAPDDIVVSTGAKQSIANAVLCLIDPGDEVLVPVPYWVSYLEIIKLAEGEPVFIQSSIESDFKITPQQLKDAITNKTKLLIFSTPCNPSGTVYTQEELRGLADVLKDYPEIMIISDEIYEHINFTGEPHQSTAQFESIKDRVVTVNGVSKGFAMTGWRLGYIGAPKWIAQACSKMQGQFTSGTSAISQRAAITAMEADLSVTFEMREAFRKRRDLVVDMLNDISGLKTNVPQGAFYVFPEVKSYFGSKFGDKTINTSTDLCEYLLYNANVAVVPGEAFGDPYCIRISYATSENTLIEAISRIKSALLNLKQPSFAEQGQVK